MSTQVEAMPGSAARHTTSRGFVLVAAVFDALGTDLLAAHRGDLLIEDPRQLWGDGGGNKLGGEPSGLDHFSVVDPGAWA